MRCLQRAKLDALDLNSTRLARHKEEVTKAKIAQEVAEKDKADNALEEVTRVRIELAAKL